MFFSKVGKVEKDGTVARHHINKEFKEHIKQAEKKASKENLPIQFNKPQDNLATAGKFPLKLQILQQTSRILNSIKATDSRSIGVLLG